MNSEPTALMYSAVLGGPVPLGLSSILSNAFSNPISSGSTVQCTRALPQPSRVWAMLTRGAAGSAPLGFDQSLPPRETTLYSHAQNISHLVLVNFVSINTFSDGANRDLVQTVSKVLSHVSNGHQIIFFTAYRCPKTQERLCLLTKLHAHLWEGRNKEYHWSHWCPINK